MKPLIVLLTVFFVAIGILAFVLHRPDWALAARIAMSVMLAFTSIAHFAFAKGMTMMIPSFFPNPEMFVYGTGVIEIAAAVGLQIPRLMPVTAWLLLLFFLLMLPANIYAAMHHVNYQKGTNDGPGLNYLWFRIPLQVFFIAWVYMSCLR